MNGLTLSVSLQRKVNLGNFESADVFLSVSGINPETTPEDVDALLDGPGAVAYRKMADRLKEKVSNAKNGYKPEERESNKP